MRRILCVLALAVAALPAAAQDVPKVDISAGYSYLRVNPADPTVSSFNSMGASGSFAWNLNNKVGIVADVGGYSIQEISGIDVDATIMTYMFGPRFTYRTPERFHPYVQVLFGGAHLGSDGSPSGSGQSAFAFAGGGGADVKINDRFSVRLAQFEYLLTRFDESVGNNSQHNFRFTTGVTIHFGKK